VARPVASRLLSVSYSLVMRRILLLALLTLPLAAQVAPPNEMGVSMGHLHLTATDPDAVMKLWIDVLGGEKVMAGPLEFAMFPGVFIAARKGEPGGATEGSVVNHLGFLVRDLDATKAKLTGAGVTIEREMPETRQMFAMFPGDIRVEFTEDKTIDVPIKHHHIHFASNQVEEMRAWYAEHFGAVPGMRGRFKAADIPGVNLSWNPAETAPAPTKGRAMDHIGFEVTDIKAFCEKLEADGVKLDSAVKEVPSIGLTIAFLTDPWGTRIEITQGLARL
jgi:catechol 2,3-dioxygenase-like lactoylglutathione lyase family enzyme